MFTVTMFPGLSGINDAGDHAKNNTSSHLDDCGYRLIKNSKIVETIFLPGPSTIDEILLQAGESDRYHNQLKRVFPCGSIIDLTGGHIFLVGRLSGAQILACGRRIDLNEACETDLASVPGIGKSLAKKIVDYRDSVGKFATPEEISRVKGIGQLKAESFLPYFR
jgi:competence ComEA-like helix-hairpin-helix protein